MKNVDVAIVGGGLAGITAALELLDLGLKVVIIDRDRRENLGGLAKLAFGGMTLVNTPIQRLHGVHDSPEIALRDWHSFAQYPDSDHWPKQWAELYVNRCIDDIYYWLKKKGVNFFPVPLWAERGENGDGNSLPRYHIIWGTGLHLVNTLVSELRAHPDADNLTCLFEHRVESLMTHDGAVTGVRGRPESGGAQFEISAQAVLVASGGINGDIERVRQEWDRNWGSPPEHILNGAHRYADGTLHNAVEEIGGNITHLQQMWNYAAGIHHPKPRVPLEGLSLIPPKSALWLDATGKRFGPDPLVSGFDTHLLCKRISMDPHGYSWQLMNWKIALKEVTVSGSESNQAMRDRKIFHFIRDTLLGNSRLLEYLRDECEDVVVADNVPELVDRMNSMNRASQTRGAGVVDRETLEREIRHYDEQISRGHALHDDAQLKKITELRKWKGDRSGTCDFQKIMDQKCMPLVAIREFIVSRKSMGGIQTDLQSRVLSTTGHPLPGLYAAGEAAGFGGGGISGLKSLEGTFISNCILNARMAVRSIGGLTLTP